MSKKAVFSVSIDKELLLDIDQLTASYPERFFGIRCNTITFLIKRGMESFKSDQRLVRMVDTILGDDKDGIPKPKL